jgi:RES domain-containing protein
LSGGGQRDFCGDGDITSRQAPGSRQLQKIGGRWLQRGESAVLKVPSAIVIEEWSYLLNPLHADFGKLAFSSPKLFSFDRRVARSRKK